jgi:hypothetical protein
MLYSVKAGKIFYAPALVSNCQAGADQNLSARLAAKNRSSSLREINAKSDQKWVLLTAKNVVRYLISL